MDWLRRRLRPEQIREWSLVLLIVLAVLFFSTQIENYLTPRTFNRISTSVAILAVVAVGQTLVVLTRSIDLSVGSIVGFTAYFVGTLIANNNGIHPLAAVLSARASSCPRAISMHRWFASGWQIHGPVIVKLLRSCP